MIYVIINKGDSMYEASISFLKNLDTLGYTGYIVGGYPRDKYLGIKSDDIDICTNMTPTELKTHFNVIESFDKYGSVRISYNDFILEVTTFRKDGIYKDFRRPESVEFVDTLEEDLQRRDFIMNTLCIDKNGNYVDLMNARKDIDNKIIRVVGNIEKKLSEDPLRMIRALRFSANYNFSLDDKLKEQIQQSKDIIKKIPKKCLKKEIEHLFSNDSQEKFKQLLMECGICTDGLKDKIDLF